MFITQDIIFYYLNNRAEIDHVTDLVIKINRIKTETEVTEVLEKYKKSIKANLLLISDTIDKNQNKKLSTDDIELIIYIHPNVTSSIDPNVLYKSISEIMTTQLYSKHRKNHTQFRGDIIFSTSSLSTNPAFFITNGILCNEEPINDCILKPFDLFVEELIINPEPAAKRPKIYPLQVKLGKP